MQTVIIFRTLMIAAIGGFCAYLLGIPSAWLIGAVVAVLIAAMRGIQVGMFASTGKMISLLLGISVALNLDSGLLNQLSHWGGSVVLLSILVTVLLLVLYRFYTKLPGWTATEALFCAVPGNLAITLSVAEGTSVNIRKVALVHSVRVTLLPLLFPIAEREISRAGLEMPHPEYAFVTLLLAWLGGRCLNKVKVPAPMLIAGFTVTLVIKGIVGWDWRFPDTVFILLLIGLGASIGARFNSFKPHEVIPELKAALLGLGLMLVISGGFAVALWYFLGVPWLQAMLAYAPGGMEVMIAIAMNQQVDPIFVASHQMLRMLAMSLLVPVLLNVIKNREKPPAPI